MMILSHKKTGLHSISGKQIFEIVMERGERGEDLLGLGTISLNWNLSVIRQMGESQNGCFKKTKHIKFSDKRTFLTRWYAAYQGVRNFCFSENLTCLVFLKNPFWDSRFYYITDDFSQESSQLAIVTLICLYFLYLLGACIPFFGKSCYQIPFPANICLKSTIET